MKDSSPPDEVQRISAALNIEGPWRKGYSPRRHDRYCRLGLRLSGLPRLWGLLGGCCKDAVAASLSTERLDSVATVRKLSCLGPLRRFAQLRYHSRTGKQPFMPWTNSNTQRTINTWTLSIGFRSRLASHYLRQCLRKS
eukprot:5235235-Amphidinium_carterae.1